MTDIKLIAQPVTRKYLRALASALRSKLQYGIHPSFDIVRFLEIDLPKWDPDFTFLISETLHSPGVHALTHIHISAIEVLEEVYTRACSGSGRDRMTLAHELGHLILHTDVSLARRDDGQIIRAYEDPEWQAKAFAGELMIPLDVFRTLKDPEDAPNIFGVSREAVEIQMKAWSKDHLI